MHGKRKEPEMSKTKRAAKRRGRRELRLITATIICLLCVAFVGSIKLRNKNEAYRLKEEQLMSELEEEQARSEEIEDLKKYVQTKKYVEDIAKERLGLIYADEILFKAVE